MNIVESIKRHPVRTTAAAVLLSVAAAEVVSYAQNPTYDVPADSCLSPMAVSPTYNDPGANLWLQTYTGAFTTGVIASGTVPEGAYGIQASFEAPDAGQAEWNNNASDMIKVEAGKFAVKMAIGDGEVRFGVRVVAPAESPLCNAVPAVAYEHVGRGAYFGTHEQLPWWNPVAGLTNLVAAI